MKLLLRHSFWVLPILSNITICVASVQGFSIHNDLLAFPQYEVIFSEALIRPEDAERLLSIKPGHGEEDQNPMMDEDVEYGSGNDDGKIGKGTYEKMVFQGRSFLCTIPFVLPKTAETENASATSKEEQEKELIRATDRGWELLKSMKGHCIYYAAGWWVYSFCYDDGIKQFHPIPPGTPGVPFHQPTEDPNSQSYVLGRFGEDAAVQEIDASASQAAASQLQTRGETNYLVQRLGGGTVCDLTGRERRIEVQFHCNPTSHEKINLIKETASCVYLMIIHTPKLCNDVAFLPPQRERPHTISCQEIVSNEDFPEWTRRKTEEAERTMFAQSVAEEGKKPLVIGGIEVGGKKLVGGSPERSIRVPHNIGSHGQSEILLGTVASSDGKYNKIMSDREIKNLGIKVSKADIERSIREMEEIAKGKPWELNVVKTPSGLKIEGVAKIDNEDKEEKDSDLQDGGGSEQKDKSTKGRKGNKSDKLGKKAPKTDPKRDEDDRYSGNEDEADDEEERGSEEEFW